MKLERQKKMFDNIKDFISEIEKKEKVNILIRLLKKLQIKVLT